MRITIVPEANKFLRRKYGKAWARQEYFEAHIETPG